MIFKNFLYKIYVIFYVKIKLYFQLKPNQNILLKKKKILLPLIETSHYQVFQLLLIAKGLQLRGNIIKVLLCGETLKGCEIKSFKNEFEKDPCWKCRFNNNHLVKLFNLDVIYIDDFFDRYEIEKLEKVYIKKNIKNIKSSSLKKIVDDSVTRYFFGNKDLDKDKIVFSKHYHTAIKMYKLAEKIHKKFKPNIVLSNMSSYSTFEPFISYFKYKKVSCRLVSMTALNFKSVVVDLFDLMKSNKRFNDFKKKRNVKYLTNYENKELQGFLNNRFTGRDQNLIKNNYVNSANKAKDLEDDFERNKKKIKVFLFSNLHWDVGLSDQSKIFKGVEDWLIQTIKFFKINKKFHLYIKPHPAEDIKNHNSLITVEKIIINNFGKIPDFVTIIKKEYKINIFDYKKHIDLCLLYSGTLGLEMLLNKKKIIAVGHCPYSFLIPKVNKKIKYFDLIKNFMKIKEPKIEDVRLFAYFFFLKTPIPWKLSDTVLYQKICNFNFQSLNSIKPKKNYYFDHLIDVILNKNKNPENW